MHGCPVVVTLALAIISAVKPVTPDPGLDIAAVGQILKPMP
jgi:hypothetical protein